MCFFLFFFCVVLHLGGACPPSRVLLSFVGFLFPLVCSFIPFCSSLAVMTFRNKVSEAAELILCCITLRTKTPRSVCLLIQVLLQLIPLSPKPFAGLLVFVAFSWQTCRTLTTAALTILTGHCSVEDRIVRSARYKQACNSFDLHGFRVYFLSRHRFDLLLLWYSGTQHSKGKILESEILIFIM